MTHRALSVIFLTAECSRCGVSIDVSYSSRSMTLSLSNTLNTVRATYCPRCFKPFKFQLPSETDEPC